MKSEIVTLTTTAKIVVGGDGSDRGIAGPGSVALPAACLIRIPTASVTVYFGGQGVTAINGCPFIANEDLEVDLVNEIMYGVVASGTQDIYVLRRGD